MESGRTGERKPKTHIMRNGIRRGRGKDEDKKERAKKRKRGQRRERVEVRARGLEDKWIETSQKPR
jgi:hypothetical protein